ncbi:MAG: RrF2 family transcriptional regulator [bacterium]
MKISTKGRYGLRAMVDLAVHLENGDVVTISSISERQDISKNYLEQVFSPLRKSGLVIGVKGPQGGYVLGRVPEKITIGEILRTLEGKLFEIEEQKDDSDNIIKKCVYNTVWNVLDERINEVVDNITIKDLVEEYKRNKKDFLMYYI